MNPLSLTTVADASTDVFDATDALSLIILWIIVGYLTVLLNCDLQRLLMNNPVFLHVMAFVSFLLLMTTTDPKNRSADLRYVVAKTLVVYLVFVMITKSKWYFALPVIVVLIADQALKRSETLRGIDPSEQMSRRDGYVYATRGLILVLVVVGMLDYARLQRRQYKSGFSWYRFFFGLSNRCRQMPA